MLLGGGQRISGAEVRAENVAAAVAIANVIKSSLGPHGLDKMLVDDIGVRGLRFSQRSRRGFADERNDSVLCLSYRT